MAQVLRASMLVTNNATDQQIARFVRAFGESVWSVSAADWAYSAYNGVDIGSILPMSSSLSAEWEKELSLLLDREGEERKLSELQFVKEFGEANLGDISIEQLVGEAVFKKFLSDQHRILSKYDKARVETMAKLIEKHFPK